MQITAGPAHLYKTRTESRALSFDPAQQKVLEEFETLYRRVIALGPRTPSSSGFWGRFGAKKVEHHKGLYLYGDVGRGKSMMMDLFHESLPADLSRRMHFHLFMREAHATLHEWRSHPDQTQRKTSADPVPRLAEALTQGRRVLCLDEMDIQDIGDAMIIGRLFQAITDLGVVLVVTSNRAPQDLYKDGLQRQKFLPFIDLMISRMHIVEIVSPVDHRLDHLTGMTVYLTPPGPEADRRMADLMTALSGGQTPGPRTLIVDGREVTTPLATDRVARFSFCDLCGNALGSHDYLALAETFDAIIVANIPLLDPRRRDEARRFTVLVDALYENKTALICSAAALPQDLYIQGQGAFEFHRTVSRLLEMQTDEYLSQAHCETCAKSGNHPDDAPCVDRTSPAQRLSPNPVYKEAVAS